MKRAKINYYVKNAGKMSIFVEFYAIIVYGRILGSEIMNFEKMTKEELIDYINSLGEEQTGKYGLVWDKEKEPEQIVLDCDKYIPILEENKELRLANLGQNNIIIEGDNFHSLSVLNYTHKESVNVIYIDPPYNTGNKDFIYNDVFVDLDDGYRHSKWLNFMEKRLKLARNLLTESGLIFISIDDNEQAQLRLLCNKIFGEKNYIETFVNRSNPRGNQAKKYTASEHEYVICYAKNKDEISPLGFAKEEIEFDSEDDKGKYVATGLRKRGAGSLREEAPNEYFPIYYNEENNEITIEKKEGYIEILPKLSNGSDGRWRWSKESVKEKSELLEARKVKRDGEYIYDIFVKKYYTGDEIKKAKSIFYEKEVNNENATEELKRIFNKKVFDYPKPVYTIKKIIEMSSDKDDVILDFFAGSGTTGQAVLELNKDDGGSRKFILCTNNENNICLDVTYPRIKTLITGIRPDNSKYSDGIEGSVKYFKTKFVNNNGTRDQLYYDLTEKCIPMLCVKSDTYELIEKNKEYVIYSNSDKTDYSCVYFDIFGESYDKFIDRVKSIKEHKNLYIFSLSEYIDNEAFKGIINYSIEPIPYKILDLYKNVVKMSKEN